MAECTCGRRFVDAEDYRDHLPCEGTPEQRRILESKRLMRELLSWACDVNDAIGHEYPKAQDLLEDDIKPRVEEWLRRG